MAKVSDFVDEALGIARALATVLEGLALSPKQADTVREVIERLENFTPTKVIISKKDIEDAVAATLPKVLNDEVVKAVTEALAAKQAENASE